MTHIRINASGSGLARIFAAGVYAIMAAVVLLLYIGDGAGAYPKTALPIAVIMLANAMIVIDLRLEYDENVCAACGYPVPADYMVNQLCTECGARFERPDQITRSRPWRPLQCAIVGVVITVASLATLMIMRL